jgi:hypothetical protein
MKDITVVSGIHILMSLFFEVYFSIVLCCWHCFPSVFSVPWSLSSFPHATSFFYSCLPPTLGGSLCVTNVLLSYCQYSSCLGSKTCFGLVDYVPFLLLVLPGLQCFCVSLIKFWQHHSSVSFSLLWAWSLPAFVYKVMSAVAR